MSKQLVIIGASGHGKVIADIAEKNGYTDGNAKIRKKIQEQLLEAGLHIVSLVHPKAVIASDVKLGTGTVVMAGAAINPCSTVGNGCIVNTGATVDHDNTIADYVHVSVGSHLAGTVSVGESTWIGVGAVVSNNVSICGNCTIGAGAVVVENLLEPDAYIGVRARKMSMKNKENNAGGVLLLTNNHIGFVCCASVCYGTERRAA